MVLKQFQNNVVQEGGQYWHFTIAAGNVTEHFQNNVVLEGEKMLIFCNRGWKCYKNSFRIMWIKIVQNTDIVQQRFGMLQKQFYNNEDLEGRKY